MGLCSHIKFLPLSFLDIWITLWNNWTIINLEIVQTKSNKTCSASNNNKSVHEWRARTHFVTMIVIETLCLVELNDDNRLFCCISILIFKMIYGFMIIHNSFTFIFVAHKHTHKHSHVAIKWERNTALLLT